VQTVLFNAFLISSLLTFSFAAPVRAEGETPAAAPDAQAAQTSDAPSGEYEIDYEEEPESTGDTEEAEPVKESSSTKTSKRASKRAVGAGGPAVQGTHSINRFKAILKSDTRSVYKKNGKSLDVDTD
jgi:hypothetical protein